MSLVLTAISAGIFDRAMEILEEATDAAEQIAIGTAQIRAFRIWRSKRQRR
jgi:hypothetical protein